MRILAIATNKTEDTELVTPVNLWRRAGFEVIVTGLNNKDILLQSLFKISCEATLKDINVENFDAIYIPGGAGVEELKSSKAFNELVKEFYKEDKYIFAMCAAPSIIGELGVLTGKDFTCYPGYETNIDGNYNSEKAVVVDGKVITANSVSVAFEFGLCVINKLAGPDKTYEIEQKTLYSK